MPTHSFQPLFVLVRPQGPANIGGAARAMGNMGFKRLALIDPAHSCENAEVRSWARSGTTVLDEAVIHSTLSDALSDVQWVIGTTGRKRDRSWIDFRNVASHAYESSPKGKVALVFGTESAGLSNEELDLCQAVTSIPTDPDHRSLNLAGAVLLMGYEMRRHTGHSVEAPPLDSITQEHRKRLRQHMIEFVEGIGYHELGRSFNAINAITRLTMQSKQIAPADAQLFHSVARHIEWKLREGGQFGPSEENTPH